jgi:type VI secretion system protein ImpF
VAELTHKERLQPSLLDRLTDENPQQRNKVGVGRELSLNKLRECVQRDLEWLLNCVNLETSVELSSYPEVAKSVLNYGMPDLAGHSASNIDAGELERLVQRAIQDFEPRILKHTVRVRATTDQDHMSQNTLVFEIIGDLWAYPVPLQIFLRTEVDLESGSVKISPSG